MTRPTASAARDFSLYLHVPFCSAKCPYCDFVSAPASDLGIEPAEYFDLVEGELEFLSRAEESLAARSLVTLYVGGGTPSLIAPSLYARFFEQLGGLFRIEPTLEWTIEINPGTIAANRLKDFLALGINRFSVGVQSFSDETLARLGRVHRSAETRALLETLRDVSSQGSNRPIWAVDLIFGAPGQTIEQWDSDLNELTSYRPHHVSVYGMTIHEGTPFGELRRHGRLDLPDEETQREMFLMARCRLTAVGYEHYEISNYALPGLRSRHNERYWTGEDYLGLGVSAHTYLDGVRWVNPSNMVRYRESIQAGVLPRHVEQPPDGRVRLGEQVMLGLRRIEGIDLARFRETFGADLVETYRNELARLAEAGLLELAEGQLRLTEEGLLVADAVMAEFF